MAESAILVLPKFEFSEEDPSLLASAADVGCTTRTLYVKVGEAKDWARYGLQYCIFLHP